MSNPSPTDPTPKFDAFELDPRIVQALTAQGFETPTPIQAQAIPPMLEGRDVIGRARTGSGKTAAFGLPLLQKVREGGSGVRALVLAPTRELALQVTEALRSFAKKLPVRIVTIYGGSAYGPQLKALSSGVPIVVGTPGRVLDHLDRGTLDLSSLELLVLDEADEMLRMGFIDDVQKVLAAAPPTRQVVLFSASMAPPIRRVADTYLNDPLEVQVESGALTTSHIEQCALVVPDRFKTEALTRILAAEPIVGALVFARTRAGCAAAADELAERGIPVDALHGDLNQAARERVLSRFRSGRLRVVVATDVAARGIDVEHLSHVINYDMPTDAEAYVHRIGRTARAGRSGVAITLVTPRETHKVRFLERKLKIEIAKIEVPSDAAIGRSKRKNLLAKVSTACAEPRSEDVYSMLAELKEEHSLEEIAAALLRQAAVIEGLPLDEPLDDAPPRWGRPPTTQRIRNEAPMSAADEVELFLPVGKARGVRPGDLVGAIANELGVPGPNIGRVTVLAHKSFVRVSREAADKVLSKPRKIVIRGHEVPITQSRTSSPARASRPQRDGPFKGPRQGGGGARPKKRWNRGKK